MKELRSLNETPEQRVAERTVDLMKAEEALRQAQKMEAVGQLTGGLAHDFNNLLTAVTGGLELLASRAAKGEYDNLDRYITMAQTGANRAAALTQRLLAFSRRQALAPTPTDADRLIAGMEEIIYRTLGPAIDVKVVPTIGLWPVLVDAPQLENALLNLCINARDAMPYGGRLTIETANKRLDARAAAEQDLAEGEYVSVCVTDTGTGMLLILFGGALVSGLLDAVTWIDVAVAAAILLVVRPVTGWIGLLGFPADRGEKLTLAFFGIRGVGTIYYLAYGVNHMTVPEAERLWGIVGLVILFSILLHGLTVTPIMRSLDRQQGRDPDADAMSLGG